MAEKVTALVGGNQIIIETGKLANQADGAVTVQLGETIVLVAAVAASKAKPGQDFFPLTVDYREKAAAAGKFPGGYFKREGRPTEKEILTSRLTDRPIRPLFPKAGLTKCRCKASCSARTVKMTPIFSASGRFGGLGGQRHSLGRTARRVAHRPHQGPIYRQSHPQPDAGQRPGPDLRRQCHGRGDVRRLGQGNFRGGFHRRAQIRPRMLPAADPGAKGTGGARRKKKRAHHRQHRAG